VVIVFLPLRNAVIDVDGFQLDSLRLRGRSEMPLFDTTTAIHIWHGLLVRQSRSASEIFVIFLLCSTRSARSTDE
jgi:hypothetical protein